MNEATGDETKQIRLLQGLSEELSETLKKETVKTEEDKAR
jgi:hypothetical protein